MHTVRPGAVAIVDQFTTALTNGFANNHALFDAD
jgi:hypothetical protein